MTSLGDRRCGPVRLLW